MCQTGGPRCYSHARQAVTRAEAALSHAHADYAAIMEMADDQVNQEGVDRWTARRNAAWERKKAAQARCFNALADLAASGRGAQEITTRSRTGSSNPLPVGSASDILNAGQYRRERGQLARKIRNAGWDVSTVVGMTGDRQADTMIVEAARNFAATPAAHPALRPLPDVPDYASEEDKNTDVLRRRANVKKIATEYNREKGRLAEAERDVTILEQKAEHPSADKNVAQRLAAARRNADWARESYNHKGAELVLVAEKYRIAKRREVPASA